MEEKTRICRVKKANGGEGTMMVAKKMFFSPTIASAELRPAEIFRVVRQLTKRRDPEEEENTMK